MIKLGKVQSLTVVRKRAHGVYLAEKKDAGPEERVLLPAKEVPEDTQLGEPLQVFIYRDSEDRLIATMEKPYLEIGQVGILRVREVTKIGAFLDWGMPKDLLLPFREMTFAGSRKAALASRKNHLLPEEIHVGDEVLAAIYEDRTGRLAATMRVYPYLRTDSPYVKGMRVHGRVYQIEKDFGAFVAVDDTWSGLIPKQEGTEGLKVGDVIEARVTAVKEDGKLDLATREKAYIQIEKDAEKILDVIRRRYGGELPFDDSASPEEIRDVFGLSKAAFKRAVGRLYKERKVLLIDGKIIVN